MLALAIAAWAGAAAADGGVERCNGRDDDGDELVDEDFPLAEPCRVAAAPELTPDSLGVGECRDGRWQCDLLGRSAICVGGVGPVPETCDGLDNDCDGVADDTRQTWPRGLLLTLDTADPPRQFGGACGNFTRPCESGHWECIEGKGACVGGVQPKPEICDGIDNDCDGQPDDDSPATDGAAGSSPCPADRACLDTRFGFQCAPRCTTTADCQGAATCTPFPLADGGTQGHCVLDRCAACSSAVVVQSDGASVCAPFESAQGGLLVPECECLGQDAGCGSPCPSGCPIGTRCLGLSGNAGCVPESNCYYFGCFSGQACHAGRCADDPCSPNPCKSSEVCRPTRDFQAHRCVASCAGVECSPQQRCEDGVCVDTGCSQACEPPLVCRGDRGCAPSACPKNGRCSDGEFCEPETGRCLDAACEAVVCPPNQRCDNGQCRHSSPSEPDASSPDASQEPDVSAGTKSSCGCRAAGSAPLGAAWWLLGLVAAGFRRQRGRRSQPLGQT